MADQTVLVPAIGIAILVLALVVFLVWRRTGSPRELTKKSARWFLAVGLLYMVIAVAVTALVHGIELLLNDVVNMDLTLFNLGLIFFIIGLVGLLMEKFRLQAQ